VTSVEAHRVELGGADPEELLTGRGHRGSRHCRASRAPEREDQPDQGQASSWCCARSCHLNGIGTFGSKTDRFRPLFDRRAAAGRRGSNPRRQSWRR
jgi:hypothetical protein